MSKIKKVKRRLVGSYPTDDARNQDPTELANIHLKEIMGVEDTELADSILYRAAKALQVAYLIRMKISFCKHSTTRNRKMLLRQD